MAFDWPIYEFDEEFDLKHFKAWVLGAQWYPPPLVPLFVDLHFSHGKYGMQWAPDALSDPKTKGWDWRLHQGGWYLSVIETTEEERKAREPIWREKMRKILEDPWAVWEARKPILREKLTASLAFDSKKATDGELVEHWYDVWNFNKYVQESHFYPMYALGQGNIVFRRLLKELLSITPGDAVYSELHSGFENEYTHIIEIMSEVSDLAITLGLQETFKNSHLDDLLGKLATSDNGRKWLERFNQFVHDYGYMRRRAIEICTPTWWEDPKLPLAEIQRFVIVGSKGIRSVEMRPQLVAKRKKLEEELVNKIPPEERETFRKLMVCSQASSVYSEEHNVYVEMLGFSTIRLTALEIGRRLVAKGVMDDPEDVMFLHHDEIAHAGIIQEKCNVRKLANARKQEYADYRKLEGTLPMILGDPSKLGEIVDADVVFSVNAAPPVATPEEVGATLVGCAGAPGVVEGIALVCMGEEEIDKVTPGVILVTPATTPSWTPIFNIVKGVVTDGGGYLTHALIVAREFGIPAVVGTQDATRKIKTGQRIRVDGSLCRVYVLD
jgi:pyruvate, water dikinase